jgi:CRP/FNR family cyclic AMP-dependent transcriptional regulator
MITDLAQVPLFRTLPESALASLANTGRRVTFAPGAVVLRQGDPSESLFVILTGTVQVERHYPERPNPVVLATLGPYEIVGEMGLLDRDTRSATVVAAEETSLFEIGYHSITRTVLEHPGATAELLRTLSRRLRSTDDLVDEILGGAS